MDSNRTESTYGAHVRSGVSLGARTPVLGRRHASAFAAGFRYIEAQRDATNPYTPVSCWKFTRYPGGNGGSANANPQDAAVAVRG